MNTFQEFISISRYQRWLEEEGRRETREETCERTANYLVDQVPQEHQGCLKDTLKYMFLNQDVMPSMRLMMTAGPACDRDNTCAFNCSYLSIHDLECFSELMYILMCGTGAGFSVEISQVHKLPTIPTAITRRPDIKVVVSDSKEGWAAALKELVDWLWRGVHPTWDTSLVRPAGERLKTFGGRASGPGPLEDVFKFIVNIVYEARGRRLTPLECHDICCRIAESIVVGGVRRSALISLSDLDNYDMAKAKSGAWWEGQGHRALANNSAVYEGRPSMAKFLQEWEALYNSRSGERGIFNRQAAKQKFAECGRDWPDDDDVGVNPCGLI